MSHLEKNKKIKYVVYVFVFLHADKIIDTERSGLRLKSRYIFLFCIYGNQNTNMLHCFVVQKCACVFLT